MYARLVLLLLFLLYIFLLLGTGNDLETPLANPYDAYKLERDALQVLNTSSYGDFDPSTGKTLNLTTFRAGDGYAWHLWSAVRERVLDLSKRVSDGYDERIRALRQGTNQGEPSAKPEFSEPLQFYQNVTGYLSGQWTSLDTQGLLPAQNGSDDTRTPTVHNSSAELERTIKGHQDEIILAIRSGALKLSGESADAVSKLDVFVEIHDQSAPGDGWPVPLQGVYFQRTGRAVLSTNSDKFPGYLVLPHFTTSEMEFNLTRDAVRKVLEPLLKKSSSGSRSGSAGKTPDDWPLDPEIEPERCEYIMYLQQHEVFFSKGETTSNVDLPAFEHELRYPSGRNLPKAPDMQFSGVIFSPDCGFILESLGPPNVAIQEGDHWKGDKVEVNSAEQTNILLVLLFLMGGQLLLLARQRQVSSAPSTLSRVSYYTVGLMALADGFICLMCLILRYGFSSELVLMSAVAFVAFLSAGVFGMRFLMDVWTVQAPERNEARRQAREARETRMAAFMANSGGEQTQAEPTPQTSGNYSAVLSAGGADLLPPPVTARRTTDTGASAINIPSDQDIDAEIAANDPMLAQPNTTPSNRSETNSIYSQFCMLLFGTIILSVHAMDWSKHMRALCYDTLAFVYFSFWAPQIYRNVVRNCRKALKWEYVLGQSILRLLLFAYIWLEDGDITKTSPRPYVFAALASWQWVQILILASQEMLGPRFFIPSDWLPPAYDYHPILRLDEESGMSLPRGLNAPTGGDHDSKGVQTMSFDCAICMQTIDVDVLKPNDASVAPSASQQLFARRLYMVTPCRHIFHTPCLEGWVKHRLQCPICRESLPPI